MRKSTFVIATMVIVLCVMLNLVRFEDTSAMGIANGLMADMRSEVPEAKLGDATGRTREGRRSVAAYWEAHKLLHEAGSYRGLPEDHIPLIDAVVVNLRNDGYAVGNRDNVIAAFFVDSGKVGDEWERNY